MIDGIPLCPACGERGDGWAMDRDFREVYPMQEMWPGGPMVEATWEMPRMVVKDERFTFSPCGHVLPAEGLTVTFVPE